MNRIEFMERLNALLADIPEDERREAVQYYRDYFEDAGMEHEMEIIKELGSPEKVAATIKDGLNGGASESGEYRETGYTDTRFEQKETPANKNGTGQTNTKSRPSGGTSTLLKVVLITAIIIFGGPVIIPLVVAVTAIVLCVIFGIAALLFGLLIAAVAIAAAGVFTFGVGFIEGFRIGPAGLIAMGAGLLLFAAGCAGTVILGKALIVIVPGLFRGTVNVFGRIIHGKKVAQ